MRSFQLLIAGVFLLFQPLIQAANSNSVPNQYFQVVLPFDVQPSQAKEKVLQERASQAMQVLLMRLTGQLRLVESGAGQKYIAQAQGWLANYNIKPRYEDGVAVGKNVQFNFDINRLIAAFEKQNINLWSAEARPSTLVMGAFIQAGRLQKLTSEVLDYRIDIDFREQLNLLAIPYQLPETDKNWVFPVEPSKNRGLIQEQLLANQKKYLLSFKLTAKSGQAFELEWFLFNRSGVTLLTQSANGADQRALLNNMYLTVMQYYVKQNATQIVRKNHVLLSLSEVKQTKQIELLLQALEMQQPLIKQAKLASLSKNEVILDIEYQGSESSLLNWLNSWSAISLLLKRGESDYEAVANPVPVVVDNDNTETQVQGAR